MYTQENKLLSINTPLGVDELLLTKISGFEGLSTLFCFDLDLISNNHEIVFKEIIGKPVTLAIKLVDGTHRHINGLISRFCHQGNDPSEEATRFSSYSATLVPWFWLLTRTADSRIFQNLSVPDIAEKVFSDHDFSNISQRLQATYTPREYCVQYRETDFDFLSRLFEEEGIFYFFEHDAESHTLVIADSPNENKPCPKMETVRYLYTETEKAEENTLSKLKATKQIVAGCYTLNDYNPEVPTARLKQSVEAREQLGPGKREVYDFPGEYGNWEEGSKLINVRIEEEESRMTILEGESDCRAFTAGYRFKLEKHFREELNNKEYVLTRINIQATQGGTYRSGGAGGNSDPATYTNQFECIPHEIPFRPARTTPRPVVQGVQTAIVVGPEGEQIYTDNLGRVKVQFHWDRRGEHNEKSTCWIRVCQSMAGNRWGSIFLPRINHEVIVDFLEGDPDRPIITGQVFHGNNLPPYTLPEHKTITTFKSNSSPEGDGFNEIRFEDKKGKEQIFIHGEKNLDIRIKRNRYENIGKDRHLVVENDKKEHIKNDRNEIVEANHKEEIRGQRDLTVMGSQRTVVESKLSLSVNGDVAENFNSDHSESVAGDLFFNANNIVLEAQKNVTIKVGQSYIAIEGGGIKIGTMGDIELEATGQIKVKGASAVKIESPATAEIKSTSTTVKGDGMLTLKGGIVMIN